MLLSRSSVGVVAVLMVAFVAAVAACALPEDPYRRWESLDGTPHANARWIYERTHFDPTPIDVAIVGDSRTGKAVNAPRLASQLSSEGAPLRVVNFWLPKTGRNMTYAIVKELVRTKHPKLIIIGASEQPSRYGHEAFKYVASTADVIAAGHPGNFSYFSDLIYLPYRHLSLFAGELSDLITGHPTGFDPRAYKGASVDTTGDFIATNGRLFDAHTPGKLADLERGAQRVRRETRGPYLPPTLADIEFADDRVYTRKIAELAQARGVKVAFLFIPYFGSSDQVQAAGFYDQIGQVWTASFLSSHPTYYFDSFHLTSAGATLLTDWLASRVSGELRSATQAPMDPGRPQA